MTVDAEGFAPPPHRARIFSFLLASIFCGQLGLSILAPFFPQEAAEKNVDEGILGWIFGIFEVATMLGTPIAARLNVSMGPKLVLAVGNGLGGLGNVLFALCWYLEQTWLFTAMCFILRISAGFAFALQSTTAYSMVPSLYGPALSSATGTMEGVNGLAMIMGPIVGSVLFTLGAGAQHFGYVLPFAVLGGLELGFAIISLAGLPNLPRPPPRQPRLTAFSWRVVLPVVNCVVMGMNLGLLSPTLQPHLSAPPLGYSVSVVGLVYAAACAAYAVSSPIAGAIDDYTRGNWAVRITAFGALISGAGYAWLGPVPLQIGGKKLELNAAGAWGGTCLIGVGCSFGFIPVYKQIMHCAKHEQAEERDLATSTVFTVALSAGSFLGPTVGGMLSQAVGVKRAYSLSGLSLFCLSVLLPLLSFLLTVRNAGGAVTARGPLLTTNVINHLEVEDRQ